MASERVPEIDLLRFAAAAAVVAYHNTYRIPVNGIPSDEAFPLVQAVTKFGYLGVELFFLISGFVILWSASAKTVRQFVMSRALRLCPSFWVSIALTLCALALMGPEIPDLKTILGNLTILPGYAGVKFIDGVYWTLAVEIKFYVVVAALLLFGQIQRVELILWAWLAGLVLCQLHVSLPGLISMTMFPYGQQFAGGCWAYLIRSKGASTSRLAGFIVSLALALASSGTEAKNFLHGSSATDSLIVQGLIVACFGALLSVALRWWTLKRAQLAMTLGALTYPLYLLHNRIGKLVYVAIDGHIPTAWSLLLITVTGFLIAFVVTATVERRLVPYLARTELYRRMAGLSPT